MQMARVCDKFGVCDDSHLDLIMNPLFLKDLYIKTGEQYKIKLNYSIRFLLQNYSFPPKKRKSLRTKEH